MIQTREEKLEIYAFVSMAKCRLVARCLQKVAVAAADMAVEIGPHLDNRIGPRTIIECAIQEIDDALQEAIRMIEKIETFGDSVIDDVIDIYSDPTKEEI